ncbi:hypothetical protein LJK87_28835 [Paenibacillus sp. P25]|nr:hypothetical protein LJK87_28835 [Paenibacillus sp. P25]
MLPKENGDISIDRVYCLDFHVFSESIWEQLGQVYLALPHPIMKENQCPAWFGEEGASSHYLFASVEPSGLQIVGEPPREQWAAWEDRFHAELAKYSFPFFEC